MIAISLAPGGYSCKEAIQPKLAYRWKALCDAIKAETGRNLYRDVPRSHQLITFAMGDDKKRIDVLTYDMEPVTFSESEVGRLCYRGLATENRLPFLNGVVIAFKEFGKVYLYQYQHLTLSGRVVSFDPKF